MLRQGLVQIGRPTFGDAYEEEGRKASHTPPGTLPGSFVDQFSEESEALPDPAIVDVALVKRIFVSKLFWNQL